MSSISTTTNQPSSVGLLVIFGRPGAGKTTVSEKVIELLEQEETTTSTTADAKSTVQIDLDVCVPQWMRDNFAKGMYPTLVQRQEFALGACDYVDRELKEFLTCSFQNSSDSSPSPSTLPSQSSSSSSSPSRFMIISFSFVNTDLRDTFRSRFPQATWILVNTSDEISQERIQMRQGHFYKGAPPTPTPAPSAEDADVNVENVDTTFPSSSSSEDVMIHQVESNKNEENRNANNKIKADPTDNSEWDFAPVTFDHVILDGLQPIKFNAKRIIDLMKSSTNS